MLIRFKRGLRPVFAGEPEQVVTPGGASRQVAVLGADYQDLRCSLQVGEGDTVALGQALFVDRRHPRIRYPAPASGRVRHINLGPKRSLESLVIDVAGDAVIEHEVPRATNPSPEELRAALLEAGLWPALRARPFDRVPAPDSAPVAVYVAAHDTRPLCPDPAVVIGRDPDAFSLGLTRVAQLAPVTYVCVARKMALELPDVPGVLRVDVAGPHPSGLPGSQIHRLSPGLSPGREVWHIGYQDVLRIGRFWRCGRLDASVVVAMAGSGIHRPRLVTTSLGTALDELLSGETRNPLRVLSGCPLSGREPGLRTGYLGRYHNQVTGLALARGTHRDGGSGLAVMLPVERFDRVWPLTVAPSPLLRALLIQDTDTAQDLGCLALAEEDMALCRYVCPGQQDYGAALRQTLHEIERLA